MRPQDQWKRAFVICTHDLFLIVCDNCVCMSPSVLIKPYRRGCLARKKRILSHRWPGVGRWLAPPVKVVALRPTCQCRRMTAGRWANVLRWAGQLSGLSGYPLKCASHPTREAFNSINAPELNACLTLT